jgi:Response regulators consisting of a CheY-like receiver domain and a winged-helix DNA-binding domain
MAKETVLVVDDDASLRDLVVARLGREGYSPLAAASGEEALHLLRLGAEGTAGGETAARCDLVILDIMLGGIDGFELLKAIRASRSELPVILLSARGEDHDKVLGFGLGADDYVTKPFSPAELMARVKARLRRRPLDGGLANKLRGTEEGQAILEAGPFRLDLVGWVLYKEGRPLELSARELALMRLFIENPGRVFTKAQIYAKIWEGEFYEDNTVMVHISRLRDKVEEDSSCPRHILTVRGLGYKFAPGGPTGKSP